MRSLYVREKDCNWAPDRRRVLEVTSLAKELIKTFCRLFKRETGLSFRGWWQRARLLSSLNGLEEGVSVTSTALSCGYDSTSAFIAAFKGLFGRTPGELFRG
jgi:AraC-like DNA-binding protein